MAAREGRSNFPLAFLNDDILVHIFLRLPYPSTLLRCALTNKRHLRLISDPSFLRLFCQLHPEPPPLLGCLFVVRDRLDSLSQIPLFIPVRGLDDDLAAAALGVKFSPICLPHGVGGSSWSTDWQIRDCADGHILLYNQGREEFAVVDPLVPQRCVKFCHPALRDFLPE